MRKVLNYIIFGLVLVAFIYVFVQTGSFTSAITVAGIGLAWLLFNDSFGLYSFLSKKSNKKMNDRRYKKDKKDLEKKTENNPTLR